MSAIIWDLQMQLDIPELDMPRRMLVEIFNRMDAALHNQIEADEQAAILRRFIHVARDYLALEQRYLMLREQQDELRRSREDNAQQFYRDALDGLFEHLDGKNPLSPALLARIKGWLLAHLESGRILKAQPGQVMYPSRTIS